MRLALAVGSCRSQEKGIPLPLSAITLVICVLTGSVGKYLILGILTVVWPIFARQVSARTPGR